MNKPLSLHIMREAAHALGGECLSISYISIRCRLKWRCAEGYEWWSVAQNVRKGKWCKQCNGMPVVTIDEMRALARARGGRCLSLKYVNIETKLSWRCVVGHVWRTTPHHVRQGSWCHMCSNQRQSEALVATLARKKGIELASNVSVRKRLLRARVARGDRRRPTMTR